MRPAACDRRELDFRTGRGRVGIGYLKSVRCLRGFFRLGESIVVERKTLSGERTPDMKRSLVIQSVERPDNQTPVSMSVPEQIRRCDSPTASCEGYNASVDLYTGREWNACARAEALGNG